MSLQNTKDMICVDPDFGERLKQTAAMFFYFFVLIFSPLLVLASMVGIIFCPLLWPFACLYAVWFAYDYNTPFHGSRCNEWVYNWPMWKHLANYFPIEVHKTAEIPPDKNYVFSQHPHGILGSSSFILLGTGGCHFRQLFPGIKMHAVTLGLNFLLPLRREFCLLLGNMISPDAEAIEHVLARPEKGNAVGIVPGGAAEAMHSFPGTQRLMLAKRKGFVRLAIKHGASLVPVYHFGETDLFEQMPSPEGSWARKFQDWVKRHTSFSIPLAYGQNYLASVLPKELVQQKLHRFLTFGLLPFRRRVVTVVGAPIAVEKDPEPSQELVDAVHAEYCAKLKALFDEHKTSLGGLSENAQLELI